MELNELGLKIIRNKGNIFIQKLKTLQEICQKKCRKFRYMIFVFFASALMVMVFLLHGSFGFTNFHQGLYEVNNYNNWPLRCYFLSIIITKQINLRCFITLSSFIYISVYNCRGMASSSDCWNSGI